MYKQVSLNWTPEKGIEKNTHMFGKKICEIMWKINKSYSENFVNKRNKELNANSLDWGANSLTANWHIKKKIKLIVNIILNFFNLFTSTF